VPRDMDPRVKPEGDGWCVERTWEVAALGMVDSLEISASTKNKSVFSKVKEVLPISLSVAAVLISLFGYLNSRKATEIANKTYQSQFSVFWQTEIITNSEKEQSLRFEGVGSGKFPEGAHLFFPNKISVGYRLLELSDYEVSITNFEEVLKSEVISSLENIQLSEDRFTFLTYELPFIVHTRFSSAGEMAEDWSTYGLVFNIYLKAENDSVESVIDFKNVRFRNRGPDLGQTKFALSIEFAKAELDEMLALELEHKGKIYVAQSRKKSNDQNQKNPDRQPW